MSRILVGTGLATAALIAIACGNGSSTTPTGEGPPAGQTQATISTVPIGQSLTLSSDLLGEDSQVVITVQSATVQSEGPDQFSSPQGEFVVADVVIESKSGIYHVNPLNFAIVAKDGTKGNPTFASFDPMLQATDLQTGQKASGKVVFDVAKGTAAGSKIAVKEVLGTKDIGYWQM